MATDRLGLYKGVLNIFTGSAVQPISRVIEIFNKLLYNWGKSGQGTNLFDGYRFGEVAGLVDIETAKIGDIVGKELQRHNVDNRRENI